MSSQRLLEVGEEGYRDRADFAVAGSNEVRGENFPFGFFPTPLSPTISEARHKPTDILDPVMHIITDRRIHDDTITASVIIVQP